MKEELKEKLIKHINFLEDEVRDYPFFKNLTREEYITERDKRRNVERWIENIVNSSIDIAKFIIVNEGISLPETYREIVNSLSLIRDLQFRDCERLSHLTRLRNIISHAYLDIKWDSISRFVIETEPIYTQFIEDVKRYLKEKLIT